MYIESMELKDFRNYEFLSLRFDKGTNIFYGDNAQGKTNILEAVYLCGTTKSHRGSKDREMIRFHENESHIKLRINKGGISHRIDMHLKKNKAKGIAIDGIPIRKAKELLGIVNIVFFSPEDLNIIKNGPGERRRFLDSELCQLNKIYLSDLFQYNHILNQRNKLLKDIAQKESLKSTLDIWDEQLVRYGASVIRSRREFVREMNEVIQRIHSSITGEKEQIELIYEPNVEEEQFLELNRVYFADKKELIHRLEALALEEKEEQKAPGGRTKLETYLQEITEASALTRELAALFIQDVQIGERDDKTGAQEIKIDWLI